MKKIARVNDVHHRAAPADCVNPKPTWHVFFPDAQIEPTVSGRLKVRNQHIGRQEVAHPESDFGLLLPRDLNPSSIKEHKTVVNPPRGGWGDTGGIQCRRGIPLRVDNKGGSNAGNTEAVKLPTTRGFRLMPDRDVKEPTDQQSIWNRNSNKWGGMALDILQHLREWGRGRNNIAVHWEGYGGPHQAWGDANIYYGPTPDGRHVFGTLWEPGKLAWYIDGKKTAE